MSINPARNHTILIADAAVSVVNVTCTAGGYMCGQTERSKTSTKKGARNGLPHPSSMA
ncbi:hypothetical protein [Bradyrhizobium australafricanum]|uniref:hypothetical protein n=1 Tax=Bradyrhizobium australafricanum TaxID=2821406 RepID=UPI001CE34F8B|nr:hypothetical protein [Bradyrhizobium australafricanum]MCA6105532.1 hypothetical protein [Bradyrhizobium australafricanum]